METRHWYYFSPEGKASPVKGLSLADTLALRKKGGFLWLAYIAPKKDELDQLVAGLGIHPLSIDDCFDEDYLPKMDLFTDYAGLLFNDFVKGPDTVGIRELNFFLGKDYLVSVFRDGKADLARCESVLADLNGEALSVGAGPARVLYALLDRVIDSKFASVEQIGDMISKVEDSMLTGSSPVDNMAVHGIRQNLLVMRKSLFHEREILARICRHDSPLFQKADLAYFSNLYDHLAKFVEIVESNRETITNLVQIQLSLASNAMAESANRTNRSVNRLTLITTIFMPLSLIASIGGMSEWTMITGPDNWKIAYPILLGAMVLVGVVNFIVLKKLEHKE
jgi:magnesium transporter